MSHFTCTYSSRGLTPCYNDGASSGTGDTGLFLAFKRHPVVAPHLAGAHLGSADTEASDWLVVDRQEQVLFLATQAAAR